MNVHLVSDEKFINQTVVAFEKFYPKENIFFVDTSAKPDSKKLKYVHVDNITVFTVNLADRNAAKHIESQIKDGKISNVIIHALSDLKANTSLYFKDKYQTKLYWICNGADLYGRLMIKGKYQLFDQGPFKNRVISTVGFLLRNTRHSVNLGKNLFNILPGFFKNLDFFCTWNYYDYKLFNRHYTSNAILKSFHYPTANELDFLKLDKNTRKHAIIVNQSASKSGNHLTILKKLKQVDQGKETSILYVPISYGADNIKKEVQIYGEENLKYCFKPLTGFIEKDKYFDILKEVKCAFFGHRRQEAANNILFLLAFGAKVFLRKDNNLLNYFKDKGFHIYEYEVDFKSMADLNELSEQQQRTNFDLARNEFSEENIAREYSQLINIG